MSIINLVGNTPIIKLENPFGKQYGQVFVKLEEFNPGGSHKSRIALQMVEDAEISGKLNKGSVILEATGGNTGIGLCLAASIKGYRTLLIVPDTYSQQKIKLLRSYGAEVILADHKFGNDCHIKKAKELSKENPQYIWVDQLSNESNPKAHYYGTGKEIFNQMQGEIDYFVAGMGSGGTMTGVARRLKERIPNVKTVAVQPNGCDFRKGVYVPHKIQGLAVGRVGAFVDFTLIDEYANVEYEEVMEMRKWLITHQGLSLGISAGANILVALKISKRVDCYTKIVTVAPDNGTSYLQ